MTFPVSTFTNNDEMKPEPHSGLFEPWKKLVEVEILGRRFRVPENNILLRCFQYLSMETISYGDFCWNGDCANCQVWLEDSSTDRPVLSCRTKAEDGMRIVRMADEIRIEPDSESPVQ